jgi:hypothetical protein
MACRRFVLIPLLEIAPTMMAPDGRTRYADALAGLDENKKVKKLKGNEQINRPSEHAWRSWKTTG